MMHPKLLHAFPDALRQIAGRVADSGLCRPYLPRHPLQLVKLGREEDVVRNVIRVLLRVVARPKRAPHHARVAAVAAVALVLYAR